MHKGVYSAPSWTSLCLLLISLAGCGDPKQSNLARVERKSAQPLTGEASSVERAQLRASFETMAPKGWTLTRFFDGGAAYIVSHLQGGTVPKKRTISGAITLDGRNETMVKFGNGVPHYHQDTDQQRENSSRMYPEFDGFKKDVGVGSVGHDIKSDKDIHPLAYYNLEKRISCYGHAPGQFQCYWGTPNKRMSLYFDADDLGIALPYVLTTPGAE